MTYGGLGLPESVVVSSKYLQGERGQVDGLRGHLQGFHHDV